MEQVRLEALYLGFRMKKGVVLEDFKNQYDWISSPKDGTCWINSRRKD